MHNTKRLVIVHSPKSTNAERYEKQIKPKLHKIFHNLHEIALENLPYIESRNAIVNIIKDNDVVIAAGGDGIANVAMDAVALSGKDIIFATTPLGNFNDFSRTVNGNITDPDKIINSDIINFHPLDLSINGEHFLYAGQYITLGATARLTDFLNSPKARQLRKKVGGNGTLFGALCAINYQRIFSWLGDMSNIMPTFHRNDQLYHDNNIGFMLGPIGGYFHPKAGVLHLNSDQFWFHHATLTGKALRDVPYITSWFGRNIPGELSSKETLVFDKATDLIAQVGGDKLILKSVTALSCKRSHKPIKLLAPAAHKMLF